MAVVVVAVVVLVVAMVVVMVLVSKVNKWYLITWWPISTSHSKSSGQIKQPFSPPYPQNMEVTKQTSLKILNPKP